jgi:hypothetical protein
MKKEVQNDETQNNTSDRRPGLRDIFGAGQRRNEDESRRI